MEEQSKIVKLVYEETGYLADNEDHAIRFLRIFINNSYKYVEKCGADPDEQLFSGL